ncbi:MAG: phospholipase D-like domain-containing protein [bacterium]
MVAAVACAALLFALPQLFAATANTQEIRSGSIPDIIVLPDDGMRPLEDLIASAGNNIAIVTPSLNDPTILKSLRSARMRRVAVRVMLDKNPVGNFSDSGAAKRQLTSMGIIVGHGNPSFGHTRESAIIIDGRALGVASAPLTEEAMTRGRAFVAVFWDPRFAALALTVYDADWHKARANPSLARLAFSPDDARRKLHEVIRHARETLWVYAETIADHEVESWLGEAAKRGITVRVLTSDTSPAGRPGIISLTQSGCLVRISTSLRIHGSVVLADAKTEGAEALLGSQTLATPSFDENRELAAIISDANRTRRLRTSFEKDWAAAPR